MTGARLLKLLADDTRLRILSLLSRTDDLCVCELVAVLRLPQYRISRHLGLLRQGGFVQSRREGPFVFYGIPDHVRRHPLYRRALRLVLGVARSEMVVQDARRFRRLLALEASAKTANSRLSGPFRIPRGRPVLQVVESR